MFKLETDSEFPLILNNLIIEANKSEDYSYSWRGFIDGEEYKINIQSDDFNVTNINIKFRGKKRITGKEFESSINENVAEEDNVNDQTSNSLP